MKLQAKKDETIGCLASLQEQTKEAKLEFLRANFCKVCRNEECSQALNLTASSWLTRINKQEQIAKAPLFADINDPRFKETRAMAFVSLLDATQKCEIIDANKNWDAPILVPESSKTSSKEPTNISASEPKTPDNTLEKIPPIKKDITTEIPATGTISKTAPLFNKGINAPLPQTGSILLGGKSQLPPKSITVDPWTPSTKERIIKKGEKVILE